MPYFCAFYSEIVRINCTSNMAANDVDDVTAPHV